MVPEHPVGVCPEAVPGKLGWGGSIIGLAVYPIVTLGDGLIVHSRPHPHARCESGLHILPILPGREETQSAQ